MKRLITTLLLSLFFAMPTFSQVQNKFFGATLGVSDLNETYTSMYEYFDEKPNYVIGAVTIGNQYYAGYKWDAINAWFRNGRFLQVNMRYYGNWEVSSENIYNVYYRLKEQLIAKYGSKLTIHNYKSGDYESGFYYSDGRYVVELYLRWGLNSNKEKEYHEVGLWYWDQKLKQEPEEPIINNDL